MGSRRFAPAVAWRSLRSSTCSRASLTSRWCRSRSRASRTRYALLETVRAYARQKLSDAAEAALVRNQHLDYHLPLAESAEPDLFGARLEQWLRPLTTELDNFRGALGWAVDAGRVDEALRLAAALWLFFEARGHWREGRGHLESALAGEGASGLPRAKALVAVGHIGTIAADWVATRRYAEEALAIGREVGDERTVGRALDLIGWALISLEPEAAMPVLEESIAITRRARGRLVSGRWALRSGLSCKCGGRLKVRLRCSKTPWRYRVRRATCSVSVSRSPGSASTRRCSVDSRRRRRCSRRLSRSRVRSATRCSR